MNAARPRALMARLRFLAVVGAVCSAVLPVACDRIAPPVRAPGGGPSLRASVEPADGYASVDRLLAGARRTVDLSMYELADPRAESLLAAAHRRGVRVRVLLDRAYHGAAVNRGAFLALRSAGVPVRFGPATAIDHEKCLVVDHSVTAVMTGNLTARYYASTRDFVVTTDAGSIAAAVESTFDRDWRDGPPAQGSPGPGLVWSPGATSSLVALIGSAHRTLRVETEEIGSPPITAALAAAARRGVEVQLVMTADRRWAPPLAGLATAGVREYLYRPESGVLGIHAKAMVVDDRVAFVGSENLSTASLTADRELGIVTTDPAVVGPVSRTLRADVAGAGPTARAQPG